VLIEDNPGDVGLIRLALTEHAVDCELTVLGDGESALKYFQRVEEGPDGCPEFLILDLNLPKVSGLEVLGRIRSSAKCGHIPVVILTSSKEDEDVIQGYSLGANAYVRKPVDFEHFTKAVTSLGMFWLLINERPPRI